MPGPKPGGPGGSMRARPGGGMNQGMGQFGEHLDESAFQQASQQKALSQQQADPSTAQAAAQAAKQQQQRHMPGAGGFGGRGAKSGQMPGQMPGSQVEPRPVGSLTDELVKRPVQDILGELKSFFSLNTWLGIHPPQPDSPEDVAKKKKMHQRYQQLNEEQQQVAKKRYEEELQKKKMEEEEKQRQKEMEEQKKAQSIEMPSSPKKGPVGPGGSRKQKATQKLQQDRKMMGGPSGQN